MVAAGNLFDPPHPRKMMRSIYEMEEREEVRTHKGRGSIRVAGGGEGTMPE